MLLIKNLRNSCYFYWIKIALKMGYVLVVFNRSWNLNNLFAMLTGINFPIFLLINSSYDGRLQTASFDMLQDMFS